MIIPCVWEHNGGDSLLYAAVLPGAFTRGTSLDQAMKKMPREIRSYLAWAGEPIPERIQPEVIQEAACALDIRDADSDILFHLEKEPLTPEEYGRLKKLALKSAGDFEALYQSIRDKDRAAGTMRKTFYGQVPRSAREIYTHTKSVNTYYFAEIGTDADNEGTIRECRERGFAALEKMPGYLENLVVEGSYGEMWSLRKVLRRFIWHDRIHGKAMYRRALLAPDAGGVMDPFHFSI